jgi:hypothetical protein
VLIAPEYYFIYTRRCKFSPFSSTQTYKIGKYQSFPFHNLADRDPYFRAEHRSCVRECVELPVFTARIDTWGKSRQKIGIKPPPGKSTIKPSGINARQKSRQAPCDHLFGKSACLAPPQRKDRIHPARGHLFFPVRSNILQEEIAENDMPNSFILGLRHCLTHLPLVDFVWAR